MGRADAALRRFLAEDIADGDVTGALVGNVHMKAAIVSRQNAVLSGAAHAARIFALRGCAAKRLARDGSKIRAGQRIIAVSGPARRVLECERTALNLLSRMSGIATVTRQMADSLPRSGPAVYATRKTAPGLRAFDKEAVAAGGGHRHRMSLADGIMIKDSHLAAGPGMAEMVRRARKRSHTVEAEADSVRSAIEAARAGARIILLDNMGPRRAKAAVSALRRAGLRDGLIIEASGGITVRNAARYARTGVDRVSSGQITASAPAVDFGLDA